MILKPYANPSLLAARVFLTAPAALAADLNGDDGEAKGNPVRHKNALPTVWTGRFCHIEESYCLTRWGDR